MASSKFVKQPYEMFWVSASFANVLGSSEAIVQATSTVTAVDKDGNDATTDVLVSGTATADGQVAKVQVKAGTEALSPYKITFRIVSDASPADKWEHDVTMKVKEL